MATGIYEVGDTPILTGTFTAGGTPVDPTTVTFAIVTPDGVKTTYVYPTNITKAGVGVYTVAWPITQVGNHAYQFQGTGPNIARTVSRTFLARPTEFT